MRVIHDEMAEFLSQITFYAPRIPVISNTTQKPFPDDPEEIKKIIMAHLESPVQWMSNVRTLQQDFGIRTFLEVGPGDSMSNLVGQILESPDCIPTCLSEAEKTTLRGSACCGSSMSGGISRLRVSPGFRPSPAPGTGTEAYGTGADGNEAGGDGQCRGGGAAERIMQREVDPPLSSWSLLDNSKTVPADCHPPGV